MFVDELGNVVDLVADDEVEVFFRRVADDLIRRECSHLCMWRDLLIQSQAMAFYRVYREKGL